MHLNFLTPPLQMHASSCGTSVALISPFRGTSRKQPELQLTSMWPGMHHSSQLLPGAILRRTMLTSAVYDIQPSCSVQGVSNVLSLRIDVGIWRSIVNEFRKANGERFGNLL